MRYRVYFDPVKLESYVWDSVTWKTICVGSHEKCRRWIKEARPFGGTPADASVKGGA